MSAYTSSRYYSRSNRTILRLVGDHALLVGVLVGVLAALTMGSLWMAHNMGEQVTPVTGTVTHVDQHMHITKCGKTFCTTYTYETDVDLPGGQATTVTLDDKTAVGDHWTVYQNNDGDYAGYSPTSFHDIFMIVVLSLLVGGVLGFAAVFVLYEFCY